MKRSYVILGAIGIMFVIGLCLLIFFVSTMNAETRLRNAIKAKQTDNTSEFDNMWKKISQVAQVSEKHKDSLVEIFTEHAKARSGQASGGSLATWIKESVPNVDLKTFENLQNIITSSRDRWTMRQKELIDLKREHDNVLTVFPGSAVCSILGREEIKIQIVTSGKTDESFRTGKDDDVDLFKKK